MNLDGSEMNLDGSGLAGAASLNKLTQKPRCDGAPKVQLFCSFVGSVGFVASVDWFDRTRSTLQRGRRIKVFNFLNFYINGFSYREGELS